MIRRLIGTASLLLASSLFGLGCGDDDYGHERAASDMAVTLPPDLAKPLDLTVVDVAACSPELGNPSDGGACVPPDAGPLDAGVDAAADLRG